MEVEWIFLIFFEFISNASPEEICVEFKRKTLVYLLSNCPQVLKIFYD